MSQFIPLIVGIFALFIGSVLGYYARQSIAKRDYKTIEARLHKKVSKAKDKAEQILDKAKKESRKNG